MSIRANGVQVDSPAAWDDLRVPINAIKLGGVKDPDFEQLKDDGSSSTGVFTYAFDSSLEEEVFFVAQIPHEWKLGTALRPHVHWVPTTNGTAGQTVSWGLEYTFAELGEVFPDTTILYGDSIAVGDITTAFTHSLTPFGEIDMTSVDKVSSMLVCRLFRDATGDGGTDDYTSDAALLEFDIHYQIDSNGSDQQYSKSFK